MRIACPNCAAEYDVPVDRLPPARLVRCSRCGTQWMASQEAVEPPLPQPAPAPPVAESPKAEPAPVFTALDRLAAAAPRRTPMRGGLIAAWVLSVIILIGAGVAAATWRTDIERAWPASTRILR